MSRYVESLRGTGRTTRLIEEAKRLASSGFDVYIIVASPYDIARIKADLENNPNNIKVLHANSQNFQWDTLRVYGASPDSIVLVDHNAIERKFYHILGMLHAFDEIDFNKDKDYMDIANRQMFDL